MSENENLCLVRDLNFVAAMGCAASQPIPMTIVGKNEVDAQLERMHQEEQMDYKVRAGGRKEVKKRAA